MCQAIDELIMDGETRGEKRLSSLIIALLRNGKQELIEKAVSDESLRKRLYTEYHL